MMRQFKTGIVPSAAVSVLDCLDTMIGREVLACLTDEEGRRLEEMVRALADCDCEGNA